jgi:GDPmannose 4,6-dehydratase
VKAIIFGAAGQDGQYLSALLEEKGYEVTGISSNDTRADITRMDTVLDLVRTEQPAFIFHLAANSTTKHEAMFGNHAVIATGTLNILEAVKDHSPHTRVFISGSGLQFKNEGNPIKETDPFEARDPYSVSRIQSVYAARYYRNLGLKTYFGYFFNHDSPLRTERHMTKKIAEAAKRIGTGSGEKLPIGDLDAVKEYAFAGDIVKGIWTLVNQEQVTEANISSGKGYPIRDWLDLCFSSIGKNWKDYVTDIPGFKPAYDRLVSDPSRILSLGWKPEVDITQLAQLMMQS